MSPAAQYLLDGGFTRVGPVKGLRGFEAWHLSTPGAADIAVAIPEGEHAERSWAVHGIFSAGEQQGQTTMRDLWGKMTALMEAKSGHIGMAPLGDQAVDLTKIEFETMRAEERASLTD